VASVTGILVMQEYGIAAGLIVMVAAGGIAGLASGAIIAYLRTSPLIITLGMMSIAQAITLILSHGVPIYDVPESLTESVGFGAIFGIPVTVIIGIGTLLIGWIILRKTVFGRYVYAIGSNQSAAIKSGVNVRFYTMLVYAVSGCCAGIAAIVMTAWVGAAQPVSAPTLSLESLAAVVLGGLALTGGSGSIKHVFYGVLILGMLSNAMNMMGISAFYQTLAVGIVNIVAVALDRLRRRQEH
jgi:ribose transport system permease protein